LYCISQFALLQQILEAISFMKRKYLVHSFGGSKSKTECSIGLAFGEDGGEWHVIVWVYVRTGVTSLFGRGWGKVGCHNPFKRCVPNDFRDSYLARLLKVGHYLSIVPPWGPIPLAYTFKLGIWHEYLFKLHATCNFLGMA
jgi:hypothetical protein